MICKAIYNTRTTSDGSVLARVELSADTASEAMPTTGMGVVGLDDDIKIDDGSRLTVLDTGDVHVFASGEWHKIENAEASGTLEITAPGTYDVSAVALVIVK